MSFRYTTLLLITYLFASSFVAYSQDIDSLKNPLLELGLERMEKTQGANSLLLQTSTTSAKVEEKTSEAAAVMQIVSRDEILAFGGNTIGDILNRLTNFYLASPTHLFNNMTAMRGDLTRNYSSHVLLLLNGRPVRESLFGGIDMAFLNGLAVEDIDRIEIIRGAGSVLYGSGAYTGVINFMMRNEKETATTIQARMGAAGTKAMIMTQAYHKENLTLHASARYFAQDGWERTYRDRDSVNRTIKSANENFGIYLSATTKKFTFRTFYGGTRANTMNNETEWSRNYGTHDITTSRRGFTDIGFKHSFSKNWQMTINNTTNTHTLNYTFFDDNNAQFNTLDNLTEMTHFIRPLNNLNIVVGALYNLNSNNSTGSLDDNFKPIQLLPDTTNLENSYAFYTQADYRLLKYCKVIGGIQVNKTSQSAWDVAPRIGWVTTLPIGLGLKLLYGKAFRSSAHFDKDYQNKEFRNPININSETVYTTDVQVFYERPRFSAALTYYHSKQLGVIEKAGLTSELYTFGNFHNITFQGVEIEGKYMPTSQFLCTANFSYYHSKDDRGNEYTSAVPAITTCLGIAYFTKNRALSVGLYNVYFSKPADVINAQVGKGNGLEEDQRVIVNPIPTAFDMISCNINMDITTLLHIKNMPKTLLTMYGENLLGTEVWQPEFFRRNINSIPYQGIGGRAFYVTLGVKF